MWKRPNWLIPSLTLAEQKVRRTKMIIDKMDDAINKSGYKPAIADLKKYNDQLDQANKPANADVVSAYLENLMKVHNLVSTLHGQIVQYDEHGFATVHHNDKFYLIRRTTIHALSLQFDRVVGEHDTVGELKDNVRRIKESIECMRRREQRVASYEYAKAQRESEWRSDLEYEYPQKKAWWEF
jgi:hypothetical protein